MQYIERKKLELEQYSLCPKTISFCRKKVDPKYQVLLTGWKNSANKKLRKSILNLEGYRLCSNRLWQIGLREA